MFSRLCVKRGQWEKLADDNQKAKGLIVSEIKTEQCLSFCYIVVAVWPASKTGLTLIMTDH